MKLRNVLKIGMVIGILIFALSVTGYAASITSVSGTDGTNAFATSADALTAYTPLETTLTVSGTVDTAEANVTIMISAEDTVVYVNQTVADADGNFIFEFPVSCEGGYTYEVKVNTENSDTASVLYFKTEADEPVYYGDVSGDKKLTAGDTTMMARVLVDLAVSNTSATNIAAGIADVNGDNSFTAGDIVMCRRYLAMLTVSATATERLAWWTVE